ncbi:MAG: MerR family transcriptional regulator, partial [Actinobacteria bacterium]|nr:MerR family transcriptional regulator [Actinomycetota bacterium]
VGELARRAGVSAKAVRHYEAQRLLVPAPRTAAGYRIYTDHDVRLLRFIRGARGLGLSLADIRHILELRRSVTRPSAEVIAALENHLAEVDRRVGHFLAVKDNLAQILAEARVAAAQGGHEGICAVIAAADDDGEGG